MSNDPEAARRWLEEEAAKGDPGQGDGHVCPLTGSATVCGDASQCPSC